MKNVIKMIDTAILEIAISRSAILNPKRFNPIIEDWLLEQFGYRSFKNNPTAEDKQKWGYCPRLTLYKRGAILVLKLEFSVTKMFNRADDNVNEIGDDDFGGVVSRLRDVVEGMGVSLTIEQIEQADPQVYHPAKNIILSDCYSPTFVIGELKKVDISRKFDIDCKQYRNGGEVLQLYSNLHSLCLYDKQRDDKKPVKRAVEKDRPAFIQRSLFEEQSLRKVEILRMEARLRKKKMLEIFEKVGYMNPKPTFKDIFSRDLSRKILQYYWRYFFEDDAFLFDARNNPTKILNMVCAKYEGKKIGLDKTLAIACLVICAKDEDGMTGVRNIIEFYKPKNNWSKTKKWLHDFKADYDKANLYGFIKDIETQLDEFKPFRIEKPD
jgi:hypothetical protein